MGECWGVLGGFYHHMHPPLLTMNIPPIQIVVTVAHPSLASVDSIPFSTFSSSVSKNLPHSSDRFPSFRRKRNPNLETCRARR